MTLTDEHILAAYVDGSDLDELAPVLREAFARFAASGSWPTDQVMLVELRQPPDPAEPDFLPQWDLGLNLGLDHLAQSPKWFEGIESLVQMLRQLAEHTDREFALFLCYRSTPWRQEQLEYVGSGPVDLPWLRGAIERLTKRRNKVE